MTTNRIEHRKPVQIKPKRMLCTIWNYNLEALSLERQAIMGFAILWIVFFHSSGDYSRFPVIAVIKQFGNLGVDIFLLMSGIGLYYSALKLRGEAREHQLHADGQKRNGNWIISFYRKRMVRILPTTVICLLPWYLYLYRGQSLSQIGLSRLLLNVTSLSYWIDGTNRGWYVALTIVMYALYPLIFLFIIQGCTTAKRWISATALIIADIVFNTAVAIYNPVWFGMVNLALGRVPIFIVGCVLALNVRRKTERKGLTLLSMILAIGVFSVLLKYMEPLKAYAIWRYLYGVLGFCVAVILSIVFQLLQRIRIGVWIRRFFAFFGKYTLEIYLTHTQLLTVMDEQLRQRISGVVINVMAIAGSIVLAIAFHEGIEMITRRLVCIEAESNIDSRR